MDAAYQIFDHLSSWARLQALIDGGEAEGLHVECKSPTQPRLNRDMKAQLARAISGFANTAGGVILWGVATTKHSHSGLDVLSQLEPIGNCRSFERLVRGSMPTLTTPPMLECQSRIVRKRKRDTRGIVVSYIPRAPTDPLLSTVDNMFYFRSADNFVPAPFDIIKRLFAATDSPDLYPQFTKDLISIAKDGAWKIPIIIVNKASAIARDVNVSVTVENANCCEWVHAKGLSDLSSVNPGQRVFMVQLDGGIHRGLNRITGELSVKMKMGKRSRRRLDLSITMYADRMRAREVGYALQLARSGVSAKRTSDEYLY